MYWGSQVVTNGYTVSVFLTHSFTIFFFRDSSLVSTSENIAAVIFEGIKNHLPDHVAMHEITLHETDKNKVVYRGDYE